MLTTDLESGDGPHQDLAALFVAAQLCVDCEAELVDPVDGELGPHCLARAVASSSRRRVAQRPGDT